MSLALTRPTVLKQPNFRVTALIVASAMFMEQLDGTVLATALPAMSASFHVGPLRMNVALTSYLLSLAVFIPASGHVADRFGTRQVFRAAIALFTLGSVLCALSVSLPMLVASRVLQGIGGAMMVPVGRLAILRSTPRQDLVRAMTWVLVPAQIGPVLGPPVGGFFVTYLSWHWIFYINVPVGLAGMAMVSAFIEDGQGKVRAPFDWWGFALSGTSLASLMFGFEFLSRGVASGLQGGLILGLGLMAGVLYVHHAFGVKNPILDLRLMKVPSFGISVVGGSLTRITGGAVPFLLPMMMQLGLGMSAAQSGLITCAAAGGAMAMKAAGGPVLRRYGFRNTLVWNGVLATILLMSLAAFRPGWPIWLLYGVIFAGGFFQSLQFTAYNTVAYADIPRGLTSTAASFYSTFQQLMLSAGICVAAAALSASLAWHHRSVAQLGDFSVAWMTVGAISLLASPVCARFARDVGHDMTGRRRQT
jgi:EmrB/QacA subfamily drug resistance transporter